MPFQQDDTDDLLMQAQQVLQRQEPAEDDTAELLKQAQDAMQHEDWKSWYAKEQRRLKKESMTEAKAWAAETPEEIELAKGFLKEKAMTEMRGGSQTVKGITKPFAADLTSLAARPLGLFSKKYKRTADYMSRFSDAYTEAREDIEKEQGSGKVKRFVKRSIAGAARSGAEMALTAPIGPYAMYAEAAVQEANRAITGARDAGLKDKDVLKYAVTQGIIEGGIGALFQRAGLGGIEKVWGGKVAMAVGMQAGLKQAGITMIQELPEEWITELGHNFATAFYDVDPNAASPERLVQTAIDVTGQTLALGFLTGGGQVITATQQKSILMAAEVGKTPSRKQWKSWGMDPDQGKTAQDRSEGLQSTAEAIRQQQTPQIAPEEEAIQEAAGELSTEPGLSDIHPEVAAEGLQAVVPFVQETTEGVVVPQEGLVEETWTPQPQKQKGEIAQFIESSAGRIGVSVDALSKPYGFVKHAMQRFLTSRGELPESVYTEKLRRDGQLSRIQRSMAYDLKDYNRAVKEAFPGRLPTQQERAGIDDVLKGALPIEALPEPLREPVGLMRSNIDALSARAITTGATSGKFEGTIMDNLGMYVNRSYRVFDDPNWAKTVPDDVRNKAKAFVRAEYPNKTEAEVEGYIEKLLYEGTAADSPIAALKQSKLGSKDVSVLMKRGDIPREIRALWGEYRDPVVNYAKTVTKLGNLIANHQFLEQVKQEGLGTFFSEAPVVSEYGELKTKIAADESSVMHPLNGLYTTPEIRDAFVRATEKTHNPAWLQYALAANGAVKISKTIGSLMTHVRNMVGNVGFAIANGHWRAGSGPGSFKAVLTNLIQKPDAEYRNYFLRATELGIVAQDVHAGEFRDYVRDASMKDLDEFAFDVEKRRAYKTKQLLKQTATTVADIYQAEDDVWKLYAWENEKARYNRAYPEWSKDQLEAYTANIVTNTYPTYSKVPEAVRALRRFPIVGTFVSFPAEVIRTAYHTAALAKQELSDSRTRSIGAERAIGLTLSITAASSIAAASRYLVGMTGDEDKDLRWFVPPWQKNSEFLYIARPDGGQARYVDLAYSDPHNYLITPLRALLGGKDPKDGLWEAFKDISEPFAGEEILFGKMVDVWSNNDNGRQIYNPQDSVDQQAKNVAAHLWSALEPGTITSGRRIASGMRGVKTPAGRVYNPSIEAIAVTTGQRIQDVDVAQSLQFRARDYARNYREAQNIWLRTITNRGSVSENDIRSAYDRAETARRGLFRDMSEAVHAATRLGVDPKDIYQALNLGGVSDDEIKRLKAGVYGKQAITPRRARAIYRANKAEAPERIRIIAAILQEASTE